jgi:hypothetical protein
MNKKLLVLLGIGALAYYVWYKNKKDNTGINVEDIENDPKVIEAVVAKATNAEKNKYTNAFKKQFNIKLPAVQASKAVKREAFKMQDKRYAKQIMNQLEKPEVYL